MEYLVQKTEGGYYISNIDPQIITKEKNGKSDKILLEWEEEERKDTLKAFFSSTKRDFRRIVSDYENGINTQDMISSLLDEYQLDESMIMNLYNNKSISLKEKIYLLKKNAKSKKDQFKLLEKITNDREQVMKLILKK